MKKYFAFVVISLFTLVGCSNDDCNCKDDTVEPIENYSKKIVGKWELDGIFTEGGNRITNFDGIIKETRDYSNNQKIVVYYKEIKNYELGKWKEETIKSTWTVYKDVIKYPNSNVTGTDKENIISVSKYELKILTDLNRELKALDIYDPSDPTFPEVGIKVFKRK